MTSPLETSLRALQPLGLGVDASLETTGLTLAPDVFNPRGLDANLERLSAELDSSDPNVLVAALLGAYVFLPVAVALGLYLKENRVPEMEFWGVAVELPPLSNTRGHGGGRLGLSKSRFYCLPDDADAAHLSVRVVKDRNALRQKLTESLEAHFKPIVTALQTRSSLRAQTLWAIIADALVATALRVGSRLQLADAALEAERLVLGAPFRGRTGVMTLHRAGQDHHFLERGACCLRYRLPGAVRCLTCPLTTRDKRVAQLYASLEGRSIGALR